ncbi:MAG: DNRLRE domain-containing protein [Ignavibacteriae bacterium]|nr:DNRLRE domain-containing protein [Ignavibacteria bacterium]MBI3364825.1 DNRLRE domain-containing protein [Ignavibacteriota bacterium]
MNVTFCSFAMLVVVSFLAGCSDEPTDVGRGLIPPQDTLRIEAREFASTYDTTFLVRIAPNAGRLLIGKHDDIEAASIVEFGGVPNFTASQRIDSAVIAFSINYFFVDSSGPFGMNAYKVTNSWSASSFLWDSLATFSTDTVVGFFAATISPRDSVIRLKVDTSLIRSWGATGSGSLALRAANNVVGMNLVLGFLNYIGTSLRPELTISYRDTADTTIQIKSTAQRAISVVHSTPLTQSNLMTLQSGTTTRGIVRFDSLAIPPKASITDARLILSLDPGSSLLNNHSRDSLIAYFLRGTTFPYDTVALASICSPISENGQKKYSADVKTIVQQWIAGRPNYGFILHTYGEFSSLDRFGLYNTQAIPALRPRLRVTYTVFP